MTTTGDIIFSSSGSTPARRAIGTTGQVLTVSGGVPVWSSPAGGGKILQVIQGTSTTFVGSSTTTFIDSGLSASITPSATSSRILILTAQLYAKTSGNSNNRVKTQMVRNSTVIAGMSTDALDTGTALRNVGFISYHYVDSPNTTSATTYKVQFANDFTSAQVFVNGFPDTSTIILMEIGA
jgi:hypothetical protein